MNAIEKYQAEQWQLLEDDNESFAQALQDYYVSGEYISGQVVAIKETKDNLGMVSWGSSGDDTRDHFKQSHESHYSVAGRATHVTLQQKNGQTATYTLYSGKNEKPLSDIDTGDAVSLCLLAEQQGSEEKRPRAVMVYSHPKQQPKWFMPNRRSMLLASGNVLAHVIKYAIKTPAIVTLLALLVYGGSFVIFKRQNPVEPFFSSYLQFIAQAYSYTMELLVLSGACPIKVCTPGQVPGAIGGWLWSFAMLVVFGFAVALLVSWRHKKKLQQRHHVFNKVLDWCKNLADKSIKRYQQNCPENLAAQTVKDCTNASNEKIESVVNTNSKAHTEQVLPFSAPEGERRYQAALTQKTFYLNDVVERIESFSTETIEKSSIVKGKVHYHNAPLTRSQETFEHRTFVYADKANYQRSIIGLLDNGKKTSAILPEGFALGAMQQGDVITSFEVTFKDFLKKKPYGTSALINKTQGTLTLAEDLQPATDELITPKFDIANGGLGLLAGAAIIGFVVGIIGSFGALLLISIVSFTVAIVAGVKVKRARIKRSQRLARFVEQRLKALINAP